MITQQQLTTVLGQLPEQFSIGELVDKLITLPVVHGASQSAAASAAPEPGKPGDTSATGPVGPSPSAEEAERAYYTSPEAQAIYEKFPSSPRVKALRGIAAGLPPEDIWKTAKEWEAERIKEKYGL